MDRRPLKVLGLTRPAEQEAVRCRFCGQTAPDSPEQFSDLDQSVTTSQKFFTVRWAGTPAALKTVP
ncbi:hypothetical protein THTE_1835 [Thermogutta terrifontis]|uniref:Uncharacterized protein n=1 Tax=Thermogutta terrifontis TaxID=1331910 RepID=A0A286RES4_9BACT|nr:hypothetical protein THTE_1835 [Thermogutta terrifontis]